MGEAYPVAQRFRMSFATGSSIAAVAVALLLFADISRGGLHLAELTVAGAVAVCFIGLGAIYPGVTLSVVLILVPLQLTLFAWLYKIGLPHDFVKELGYTKDVGTAAIIVAMLRAPASYRRLNNFDVLDWFAFGYLAIATFYLVIPEVAKGSLGGLPFQVRLNAWRLDCLFIVLMFAARRVPFTKGELHRIRDVVVAIGLLMLAVGVWESVDGGGYNRFLLHTLHVPQYQLEVLNTSPPKQFDYVLHTHIAGVAVTRVGSLFTDPLPLGFFMVIPLGLCVERLAGERLRPWVLIGVGGSAVTVVLTQTRSPILGAATAILLAVHLAFRNGAPGRYRLMVLVVAAAVVAVPLSAGSAIRGRFSTTFQTSGSPDNLRHEIALRSSASKIIHDPLGAGLGSNPATGQRFGTSTVTFSENSYLQVGVELGAAGMIAFVGAYLALLARLRNEAKRRTDRSSVAGGMWLAGWGLFITGMFLHVWTSFPVALTFWGIAGAAIGPPLTPEERAVPLAASEDDEVWPGSELAVHA
ncbi:MAG TPA: O-antigen ligase family protein [Mycobacteriales bacterium]|nr:O-antigen ligase family protein [Mycobacteriales bacterium]